MSHILKLKNHNDWLYIDKYCHMLEVRTNERDRFFLCLSFHSRNRTTEACRIASLQTAGIKRHTAVVASKIHQTVKKGKTHFKDELILHMPHLGCPRMSQAVPYLRFFLSSFPSFCIPYLSSMCCLREDE